MLRRNAFTEYAAADGTPIRSAARHRLVDGASRFQMGQPQALKHCRYPYDLCRRSPSLGPSISQSCLPCCAWLVGIDRHPGQSTLGEGS